MAQLVRIVVAIPVAVFAGYATIVVLALALPGSSDLLMAILSAGIIASAACGVFVLRFKSIRFSLRTLLIAMTLLAVVLGLGVWLAS